MTRAQTLIGVGVGPGDPELITVKALGALRRADVILVPATATRPGTHGTDVGRAEAIITAAAPDVAERILRIPFSMAGALTEREASRDDAGAVACREFTGGARTVAVATIGDPSVYSTLSYIAVRVRAELPDVALELIPGITAMQAIAAATAVPLVIGDEVLSLVPATAGDERVRAALAHSDSVVVYKAGRRLATLAEDAQSAGVEATVGSDIGLPEQDIRPLAADTRPRGYFSTVLATRPGKRGIV